MNTKFDQFYVHVDKWEKTLSVQFLSRALNTVTKIIKMKVEIVQSKRNVLLDLKILTRKQPKTPRRGGGSIKEANKNRISACC